MILAVQILLLALLLPSISSFSSFSPSPSIYRSARQPQSFLTSTSTSTSTPPSTPTTTGLAEVDSQNSFGIFSDAITGAAFSVLHAFDDCGIEDSSKNLRVLWVRALLAQRGEIDDDVAKLLLPPTTRGLVTTPRGAKLFNPIVQFTEWIQSRTEFIDGALDAFLQSPPANTLTYDSDSDSTTTPAPCNVVLFGAGYDTRALRYRHRHELDGITQATFFEVDLPSVVEGKTKLYEKFRKEHDPSWDTFPTLIPFDLNACSPENTPSQVSLIETLRTAGLKKDVPTLFVFEAVLFYVDAPAVRAIMSEIEGFANGGNGDSASAETLLCLTDSMKPFVDVPFTSETTKYFDGRNMDLLQHRARWGGAVHFALASGRGGGDGGGGGDTTSSITKKRVIKSRLGAFVADKVGALVNSYTPTQSNNPSLLTSPSFDNAWYAVAFPWQIDGYESASRAVWNKGKRKTTPDGITKPFATRLWNEPLVIFREETGKLNCISDVCPHRSAPLSMGTVEDGVLKCFYHGWSFGKEGKCVNIPTLASVGVPNEERDSRIKSKVTEKQCASGKNHACVEHEGMVYVWRGDVLLADPRLLPTKRKGDMESIPIDSVLDYAVDYSYIVENNLDSPHLFYLHDGSVSPIESIGMMMKNLPQLRLDAFTDDCGFGHLGRFGDTGRVKKLLRFDPPNIVRHGGVSGFEEEFNIIPIAPYRTRVLLRQHLPKGPILTTVTSLPFMLPLITLLVNNWNNVIGLEDAAVMTGQAHTIEDLNAPRMGIGGLGDDLITKYWGWRKKATDNHATANPSSPTPWFTGFPSEKSPGIPSGTSFGDQKELVDRARQDTARGGDFLVADEQFDVDNGVGSPGIKQSYLRDTPQAIYPPMNSKGFMSMLKMDDVVKKLFMGMEPSGSMLKTEMYMDGTETRVRESRKSRKSHEAAGAAHAAGVAAAAAAGADEEVLNTAEGAGVRAGVAVAVSAASEKAYAEAKQ